LSTIAQPDRIGLQIAAGTFAVNRLLPLLFSCLGLIHSFLNIVCKIKPDTLLELRHTRHIDGLITANFICASVGFSGIQVSMLKMVFSTTHLCRVPLR